MKSKKPESQQPPLLRVQRSARKPAAPAEPAALPAPAAPSLSRRRRLPGLEIATRSTSVLEDAIKMAPTIRRRLLAWFAREARDLPWRRNPSPYRVWVSEIMLQQTRAETVVPYFDLFLDEFPNVQALAAADMERVLKCWEGLGYYRRAHNLKRAAMKIVEDLDGQFPTTAEGWRKLPGVGCYTAGAISSIAFGRREAVVDGNVRRVLARLLALGGPGRNSGHERGADTLWSAAGILVSPSHPGDFNQAIMELGARVCLPRHPRCHECPLAAFCTARGLGIQETLPVKEPKKPIPHYEIVAAAIRRDGAYLLGKRPPESMLAGLWEFPGGKVEPGETHAQALERELVEELGIQTRTGEWIASVDHAYTHLTITLHVYWSELICGEPQTHYHSELRWIPRLEFDDYAMPAADIKFLDRIP